MVKHKFKCAKCGCTNTLVKEEKIKRKYIQKKSIYISNESSGKKIVDTGWHSDDYDEFLLPKKVMRRCPICNTEFEGYASNLCPNRANHNVKYRRNL